MGFALVAALWILVLLGAFFAAFLSSAQADRRGVINGVEELHARWAARAGLARAAAELEAALADPAATERLQGSGDTLLRLPAFRINHVPVRAALLDSRARLHLNVATEADLRALLLALGLDGIRAARVAAALADWRDPDGEARPQGAEAADYAARGLPYSPPDRPFSSVEEVRRVMGLEPELFARLAPHLTTAGDGLVNVNSAPGPVLATLPGMSPAAVSAVLTARTAEPLQSPFDVVDALPLEERTRFRERLDAFRERAAYSPRTAELRVRADVGGVPSAVTLEGVVELEGGRSWRMVRVVER